MDSFQHYYHDSQLVRFELGPRRELMLRILLDPVWNPSQHDAVVRFGGIDNYEDVAAFFRALPHPPAVDAFIAGIDGLRYDTAEPYGVVIELDGHGRMIIHSRHVTES